MEQLHIQPITLKGFVKLCNFLVNSIYEGRKTEFFPSKNQHQNYFVRNLHLIFAITIVVLNS